MPAEQAETSNAQLALVFSTPDALGSSDLWQELRALYPAAQIVGCSTAGEIADVNVLDESIRLHERQFRALTGGGRIRAPR